MNLFLNKFLNEMHPRDSKLEDLDKADKWLARYTYENLDKWPSPNTIDILLNRYPNDSSLTLYKGLNFFTKEEYDSFMNKISNNKITLNSISSWTSDKETAHQYATTKPTYYIPSKEQLRLENYRTENFENITGYRGVIISTIINENSAIDVNKSGLGHENEFILTKGTYNITNIELIKSFEDHINDGDIDINAFIMSLNRENIYKTKPENLFSHILHKKYMHLSLESKKHLFNITYPVSNTIQITKNDNMIFNNDLFKKIDIHTYSLFLKLVYLNVFSDDMFQNKINRFLNKMTKELVAVYRQYGKDYIIQIKYIKNFIHQYLKDTSLYNTLLKVAKQAITINLEKVESIKNQINRTKDKTNRELLMKQYRDAYIEIISNVL